MAILLGLMAVLVWLVTIGGKLVGFIRLCMGVCVVGVGLEFVTVGSNCKRNILDIGLL